MKVKSIVLVTNHLTPYRRKFYDDFHKSCAAMGVKFTVLLMTKCEPLRNWDYENLKVDYAILMDGYHLSFPNNNHYNPDVIKYLKKLQPDIVLMAGSYKYFTNWKVLFYKTKLNYPIYYWNEAHFNEVRDYGKIKLYIRDFIRKLILPKFDGYWYSGKLAKQFMEYYGKPNSKSYFLPNLIDNEVYVKGCQRSETEKQSLRLKWNIPNGNKLFITPARLSKVKGIHTFIDILSRSSNKHKVTILIAGTGEYKNEIEAKIKDSGLDIRLLGFQQQNTIIELYSIADCFLLPSLSDPNPLTSIEALWCGLPLLITTHVGNYPEVVNEGVNGFVIDYSKHNEALDKVDKMILSNNNWEDSARAESLRIADSKYNPQKVVGRVIHEMINDVK